MTSRRELPGLMLPAGLEAHELADLSQARPRQLIVARGEVALTETMVLGSSPAFRCLLRDGWGSLALLFIGRRKVAGLKKGARCQAAGRVALHNKELVLWNPRYDIEPSPADGPATRGVTTSP